MDLRRHLNARWEIPRRQAAPETNGPQENAPSNGDATRAARHPSVKRKRAHHKFSPAATQAENKELTNMVNVLREEV